MEVKKAIRKIIALGTGATMMGATLLGAMALDLGDYPQPFIKNGMFDGLIVIGEKAQGMDVVGAVDIGSSMQYAVRQETSTATSTSSTATVAQGVKIEKSGEIMIFGDDIQNIQDTALDETDLPTVLAEGTYTETKGETENEDVDYDQSLQFINGNSMIVYEAEDLTDDEIAADYLKLDDAGILYTYRLEFGSSVEYKNDTNTYRKAAKKSCQTSSSRCSNSALSLTS